MQAFIISCINIEAILNPDHSLTCTTKNTGKTVFAMNEKLTVCSIDVFLLFAAIENRGHIMFP